jgi:hypothetical protein
MTNDSTLSHAETPDTLAAKGHTNPEALTPGMFGYSLLRPALHQDYFYDIFDQCTSFGVNIESFHTETGILSQLSSSHKVHGCMLDIDWDVW